MDNMRQLVIEKIMEVTDMREDTLQEWSNEALLMYFTMHADQF